jgi:hypothetical protein
VSQLWTVWERAIAAELAQLKAKNAWTEVDHSSAADQILLGTTCGAHGCTDERNRIDSCAVSCY